MESIEFGNGAVIASVRDHVAVVELSRPTVLNAMNMDMMTGIIDVFDLLSDETDVWCVVLRGQGRSFCVGADQKERTTMTKEMIRRRRRIAPMAFSAMRRCLKPVVAQVHGHALGGGFELALGCDLMVVESSVKMGLVETSRGTIPGGGGTKILPLLAGPTMAREMIFTSRVISGAEALEFGIANRAVETDDLELTVTELVDAIKSVSPVANAQAKKAINLEQDISYEESLRVESEMYERLLASSDRVEALKAFQERRPPQFTGE